MLISFDSHSNPVRVIPSLTDKNTWDHRGQVSEFTDLSHSFLLPQARETKPVPKWTNGRGVVMMMPGGGAGGLGGLPV